MQGRFRVTFDDDSTEEVEANDGTAAKLAAKNTRYNKIDPSRTQFGAADRERHPAIKVKSVEELTGATN